MVVITVKRYWPGKVPEYGDGVNSEEEAPGDIRRAASEEAFPVVSKNNDRRLRRRIHNREEVRADHGRIRQPEIEGHNDDDDDDALAERRRQLKEKFLQRVQEEEEEALPVSAEEESDEEYTNVGVVVPVPVPVPMVVKSVFVPKSERDTIAERERLEAEQRALEEARKRRIETKKILVEEIRKDQEINKNNLADTDEDDDDDEVNEAEEYQAWKVREIGRIKRVSVCQQPLIL